MKSILCKFAPKDYVRLVHDPEKWPRMVTQIFIGANGSIRYELSHGTTASAHYEEEIGRVEEVGKPPGFKIEFTP